MKNLQEIINSSDFDTSLKSCTNRYGQHIISQLACLGRHTLTGIMCASGKQFQDWTADYRMYSKARINSDKLFNIIFKEIAEKQKSSQRIAVSLDDTLLRKRGKKIPNVKYMRDPLGPPFQVNFIRGQRVIQVSAAYPSLSKNTTMIPIVLQDAPSAVKPSKKATQEAWAAYREEQKSLNLSRHGVESIKNVRTMLDNYNMQSKQLVVSFDGSYTNSTVIKNLPERTTIIGRIRSDTKLYFLPSASPQNCGRKKVYGDRAPTPEQLRVDEMVQYQKVTARAVGKEHEFKIKTIESLRWRSAGEKHTFRLVVIAPLGYRLRKKSKMLYRDPAYLLCSDPTIPLEELLQHYIDRWDIEVNFRDEKTIIGMGQAQVRNNQSVKNLPKMAAAAYAALLLAGNKWTEQNGKLLPLPKWNRRTVNSRATTHDYIRQLRCELWGEGLQNLNFSGFKNKTIMKQKPEKLDFPLESAVLYAYA